VEGQQVRAKKPVFIRGLNVNHHHDLNNLLKRYGTCPAKREESHDGAEITSLQADLMLRR
jgi:hypothetical protein